MYAIKIKDLLSDIKRDLDFWFSKVRHGLVIFTRTPIKLHLFLKIVYIIEISKPNNLILQLLFYSG